MTNLVLQPIGGDLAAGSPTATLLRLNPPHQALARLAPHGASLTKTWLGWLDGRCVQGAGTYSPRDDDTRLLGIPASWGRVSAPNLNLGRVSAITFAFRRRNALSRPLYATCGPRDSGHTDLASPQPSSRLTRAVSTECAPGLPETCNCGLGSRSLQDLT